MAAKTASGEFVTEFGMVVIMKLNSKIVIVLWVYYSTFLNGEFATVFHMLCWVVNLALYVCVLYMVSLSRSCELWIFHLILDCVFL